jgi:hypothetical protein
MFTRAAAFDFTAPWARPFQPPSLVLQERKVEGQRPAALTLGHAPARPAARLRHLTRRCKAGRTRLGRDTVGPGSHAGRATWAPLGVQPGRRRAALPAPRAESGPSPADRGRAAVAGGAARLSRPNRGPGFKPTRSARFLCPMPASALRSARGFPPHAARRAPRPIHGRPATAATIQVRLAPAEPLEQPARGEPDAGATRRSPPPRVARAQLKAAAGKGPAHSRSGRGALGEAHPGGGLEALVRARRAAAPRPDPTTAAAGSRCRPRSRAPRAAPRPPPQPPAARWRPRVCSLATTTASARPACARSSRRWPSSATASRSSCARPARSAAGRATPSRSRASSRCTPTPRSQSSAPRPPTPSTVRRRIRGQAPRPQNVGTGRQQKRPCGGQAG